MSNKMYSGYGWYGDELIANRKSRYTKDEQMEILDTHPFFTGLCPKCGYKINENSGSVNCECPICFYKTNEVTKQ